jgi:taurine dioxygenase
VNAIAPIAAAPAAGSAIPPRFVPLHPRFGAAVEGLDPAAALPEAAIRALRAALRQHLVLVFRDAALTPEAQVAFTERLGAIARHPLAELLLPARPEIVLETPAADGRDVLWHADLSWAAEPNRVSALAAGEARGVTEFASQIAAYERLDPWLRDRIEYLEVVHDHPRREAAGLPPPVHPLVRVDPDTGRRALMLDGGTARRIIGVPQEDSDDLLHRLLAAATHPAIVLQHEWRRGDLVVWDNRCVLHRSRGATLLRTMTRGARPLGPRDTVTAWVSAG